MGERVGGGPVEGPDVGARGQGSDTRDRLVEATLRCIQAKGMASTTLADVASEAGMSRATLYRHVPGGRAELISAAVLAEARVFLDRLDAVMDTGDIVTSIAAGLSFGHRALAEHALLQQVLRTEPGPLLTELAANEAIMRDVIAQRVASLLDGVSLRPGVEPAGAVGYIADLFLGYLGSQGQWDLADPLAVRRLVRTQFLAGVILLRPQGGD